MFILCILHTDHCWYYFSISFCCWQFSYSSPCFDKVDYCCRILFCRHSHSCTCSHILRIKCCMSNSGPVSIPCPLRQLDMLFHLNSWWGGLIDQSINQKPSIYFLKWPKWSKSLQGPLKCYRQKDCCSKNVFKWRLKDCNVGAETICSCREFQIWASATGKARLPTMDSLTFPSLSQHLASESLHFFLCLLVLSRSWAVPFKKISYAHENVGYSVRGWDHFKCSPEWFMHFHILNSLCHWWICFFYRIGSHITDAYIRSSGIGMLFFAMCCWTISRNFVHFSVPWFVGEIFSPVTSLILWFFTTYYFKAIQITISLCLIHFCVQS